MSDYVLLLTVKTYIAFKSNKTCRVYVVLVACTDAVFITACMSTTCN